MDKNRLSRAWENSKGVGGESKEHAEEKYAESQVLEDMKARAQGQWIVICSIDWTWMLDRIIYMKNLQKGHL